MAGDLFPVTAWGRAVASIGAICGIFCIALPVTILGNNFTKAYAAYNKRQKNFQTMKRNYLVEKLKTKISSLHMLKGISGKAAQPSRDGQGQIVLSQLQRNDIKAAFEVFDIDRSGGLMPAFRWCEAWGLI